MLERIDHIAALDPAPVRRQGKLAVNLRVGEALVLHPEGCEAIVIRLEAKHGQGARVVVVAAHNVKITTP